MHVRDIVLSHWKLFGRNYYCRYDYEGVSTNAAADLMGQLAGKIASGDLSVGKVFGSFTLASASDFAYHDHIDGSVTEHQGILLVFTDKSRIIFRQSGTAGSGATIRMYMEQYVPPATSGNTDVLLQETAVALKEIVHIALQVSNIAQITGMSEPTVIT